MSSQDNPPSPSELEGGTEAGPEDPGSTQQTEDEIAPDPPPDSAAPCGESQICFQPNCSWDMMAILMYAHLEKMNVEEI